MAVEHTIATIDVSACLDPSTTQEAREKVIAAVKSACSEYGFFQVVGHGVPLTLQHQIIESCRTFFDLPLEEKQALSLKNSPSKRGYERIGEQTLEADALPDMKEVRSANSRMITNVEMTSFRAFTLVERFQQIRSASFADPINGPRRFPRRHFILRSPRITSICFNLAVSSWSAWSQVWVMIEWYWRRLSGSRW